MHTVIQFIKSIFLLFVCVTLLALQGKAQQTITPIPNSEINDWITSAKQLLKHNQLDSAIVMSNLAYTQSIQEHNKNGILYSQLVLARSLSKSKVYPRALSNYLRTLNLFKIADDKKNISAINFEIGEMYYKWGVYSKSIEHFKAANKNQLLESNSKNYYHSLYRIARSYVLLNKPNQALTHYYTLLELRKKKSSIASIIRLLSTIANLHKEIGEYKKAIEIQLEILYYNKSMENIDAEFATLNNIGFLNKRINNLAKSLVYFEKAVALSSNNIDYKASALLNIGVLYQNKQDERTALAYIYKALEIRKKEKNNNEIAKIYNLLSTTFFQGGDYESAINYFLLAEAIGLKTGNRPILHDSYKIASEIYVKAGSFEEALNYYKKYININDSLQLNSESKQQGNQWKNYSIYKTEEELKVFLAQEEVRDLSLRQSWLEKEKSQKELALANENKLLLEKQLNLEKASADQQLSLIQQRLETEKKDRQIGEINKDREIKEYRLIQQEVQSRERTQKIELLANNNLLLEQEKKLKSELAANTERRNTTQNRILISAFCITLILLLYIVYNSHKRRKINRLLVIQNAKISTKSSEVTQQRNQLAKQNRTIAGGINYASTIQSAVFSVKSIAEVGLNYFVLFKPRDIVSGDFHKIHVIGDKIVIAVVDCTGHGIPGALLSMLGVSFLNETISEKGITSASSILEELRNRVKETLGQSLENKNGSADGMDISLCIIDKKTKELQYAGAYNPLYIIRNEELTIIKGDRQPIGVYPKERPFTNNELQLETGDKLYAFTDGYIDQMNSNNEKFLPKRLRSLLLSVANKPLETQKEILEHEYESWKDNAPQTDDVLLVGIEI